MSDFSDLRLQSLSGVQDFGNGSSGDGAISRLFSNGFRALLNGGSAVLGGGGVVGDAVDFLNGGGGGLSGGFDEQIALIRIQAQLQDELQRTNLLSNITKSRHEARMAAVRNMKP